jgi:hypothetical protein
MQHQLIKRRNWAIKLFGCWGYEDDHGVSPLIPFFLPMSCCGTCCLAGIVQSLVINEKPSFLPYFQMGSSGWTTCCLTALPGTLGPLGGCVVFSLVSLFQRDEVISKYKIEEEDLGCGFCCNRLCISCHYPCSYYQMYVSVLEWNRDAKDNIPQALQTSKGESGQSKTYRVILPPSALPGDDIDIYLPQAEQMVRVNVPVNLPNPIPAGTYIDVCVNLQGSQLARSPASISNSSSYV